MEHGLEHDRRWEVINLRLNIDGYWVKWRHNHMNDQKEYAIGKVDEKQPMGVFKGEAAAVAMAKLLIEGAEEQRGG